MGKRIAILGTSNNALKDVPFSSPEWEFWGLAWRHSLANVNPEQFSKIKTWFEVHHKKVWFTSMHEIETYQQHLAERAKSGTLFMVEDLGIPGAKLIDLEGMVRAFTPNVPMEQSLVCSSSISIMLAHAIYTAKETGVKEIGIYGVELAEHEEYVWQKPGVMLLIGIARGKGIKVTVSQHSALELINFHYPTSTTEHLGQRDTGAVSLKFMHDRVAEYTTKFEDQAANAHIVHGAMQEAQNFLKVLQAGKVPSIEEVEARIKTLANQHEQLMVTARTTDGARQEAKAIITYIEHWLKGGVNKS